MTHTFPDGALQELKFGEDPNQKLIIYYYKGGNCEFRRLLMKEDLEKGAIGDVFGTGCSRPVHKNLFLEFPKYQGRFMLHFDI